MAPFASSLTVSANTCRNLLLLPKLSLLSSKSLPAYNSVFVRGQRSEASSSRREIIASSAVVATSLLSSMGTSTSSTAAQASETSASLAQPTEFQAPTKVFVAGATGNTGKRIVNQLLEAGLKVRAGVRDLSKARATFPNATSPGQLEFVQADVLEGAEKLADAIGDADAVVVATGFSPGADLTLAWKVDNLGTVALVDASRKRGVNRLVLVSSLLTNGAAAGQIFNPNYVLLNLFGLVLIAKLQAEKYIQQSGINYTIVRPGGLKSTPPTGNIQLTGEDTLFSGSISRDSVARVVVESLLAPEAAYKVVEIVESSDAPSKPLRDLFAAVP